MRIRAYGKRALFARPELNEDMVTYNMITPSAARGIFEAVCWHPGMVWIIDRIFVIKPIELLSYNKDGKNYVELKDVDYIIEAHFDITDKATPLDNRGKFSEMTKRRLLNQKFYKDPYFGSKEYPAKLELYQNRNIKTAYQGRTDLGFMLYDMEYTDTSAKPLFFYAVLNNGVLDLRNSNFAIFK